MNNMEFRTLEDTRKVWGQILWDLTPQQVTLQLRQAFADPEKNRDLYAAMRGYYFCINVWGCKAYLSIVDHVKNFGEPYILEDTGIPDEVLERAVFNQGGSMLIAGLYAIDGTIKRMIREKIEGKG